MSIAETKYERGSNESPLTTSVLVVVKLIWGPLISLTVKFNIETTSFSASSFVLTFIVWTSFSFLVSTIPVTTLVTVPISSLATK